MIKDEKYRSDWEQVFNQKVPLLFEKFDLDKNNFIDPEEQTPMFAELAMAYIDIILASDSVKKCIKKWSAQHIETIRQENAARVASRMKDYLEDKNKDGKLDMMEVKDGFFHLWLDYVSDKKNLMNDAAQKLERGLKSYTYK